MSGKFVLNAAARGDAGKGASRRLRRQEQVPAIVYGGTGAPRSITVSQRELVKALEDEAIFSQMITLKLADGDEQVILKDLQRHPSRVLLMHADFQRVSRDRKVLVHVPLHFLNEDKCHGVKNQGGMIQHSLTEVHVSALPQDLPGFIKVNIQSYKIGQSVHLSNLQLPPGVESVDLSHGPEHDLPVAIVLAPKGGAEDEETAAET